MKLIPKELVYHIKNPFRYRGYYYDEDTSLYYLQSRYYDPVTCKFINIDDPSIMLTDPYNPHINLLWDYCYSNPVVYIDPNGHRWITKLNDYKYSTIPGYIKYKSIEQNYKNNISYFKKYNYWYIYGQRDRYIASMKYGNKYIADVGCEIVATYNIMAMLLKKQNFAQIILEFELNNMYFITKSGSFGTNPSKLYKYFDAHSVKYSKYTKQSDFYNKMGSSKKHCGIVSFWNKSNDSWLFWSKGLHTISYRYNTTINKYEIYNWSGTDKTYRLMTKNEFKSKLDKHKFIIGYTF